MPDIELPELLATHIDWIAIPDRPFHFAGTGAGSGCELRLNDFPEENICTLWFVSAHIDLEEFPKVWRLPRHRGE
jgi:hypothetical protein